MVRVAVVIVFWIFALCSCVFDVAELVGFYFWDFFGELLWKGLINAIADSVEWI